MPTAMIHTTACGLVLAWHPSAPYLGLVPLTPCCQSTGKGAADVEPGESGVVCRSCYEPVDALYGTSAKTMADLEHLTGSLTDCPVPHECARHTDGKFIREGIEWEVTR